MVVPFSVRDVMILSYSIVRILKYCKNSMNMNLSRSTHGNCLSYHPCWQGITFFSPHDVTM